MFRQDSRCSKDKAVGFKFRKSRRSIKILPGVRINTGKKGITSVSIGSRGKLFSTSTNISKKGVKNSFTIRGVGTFESTSRTAPQSKTTKKAATAPNPKSNPKEPLLEPQGQNQSEPTVLKKAAQHGDTKALEALMNQAFNPKGIEVRVTHSGKLLKVLIRSPQLPDRRLLPLLRQGLDTINPQGFKKIAVTAKATNSHATWTEQWVLENPNIDIKISNSNSSIIRVRTAFEFLRNRENIKVLKPAAAIGFGLLAIGVLANTGAKIYEGRQSLDSARELIDKANTSTSDLASLQQSSSYLKTAITELEEVPSIPGAGKEPAQIELSAAHEKLSLVELQISEEEARIEAEEKAKQDLKKAMDLAMEASNMVQTPPYAVSTWESAKIKWTNAIQLLGGIPENVEASIEAQKKLVDYQNNLKAIESRLALENQSSAKYEEGRKAADQLIEFTKGLDYPDKADLPKLKQTKPKLEELIRTFRSIPSGTTQFQNAQTRLKAYTQDYQELIKTTNELEACTPSSYSSCKIFSQVRISTFTDSEASYGDTPVRPSTSGSCQCPYDRDSSGKICGARSAYSRPGGSSPICYR